MASTTRVRKTFTAVNQTSDALQSTGHITVGLPLGTGGGTAVLQISEDGVTFWDYAILGVTQEYTDAGWINVALNGVHFCRLKCTAYSASFYAYLSAN